MEVVCAVLVRDKRLFLAQRSERMKLPLMWELPGGKVEEGEDHETALKREIQEELGLQIAVREILPPWKGEQDLKHITLIPAIAEITGGKLWLKEHARGEWFDYNVIHELNIIPADLDIIERIRTQIWS